MSRAAFAIALLAATALILSAPFISQVRHYLRTTFPDHFILILGLVMSLVVVNVMDQLEWAKVQTTKIKLKTLETALDMFQLQHSEYPETEPGLVALLEPSPSGKGFVKDEESLDDAWKRRFEYEHPGTHRAGIYDLWSRGRDGRDGGEGPDGDITSWKTVAAD